MHFKRRLKIEQGLTQMDVIPLINCVFLLLIFFILNSGFCMQPPGIKIALPKSVTSQSVGSQNLELSISSENIIYLNGKSITLEQLKPLLKQLAQRKEPILIKSDRQASLAKVIEICDMCRNLGLAQVSIATNQ